MNSHLVSGFCWYWIYKEWFQLLIFPFDTIFFLIYILWTSVQMSVFIYSVQNCEFFLPDFAFTYIIIKTFTLRDVFKNRISKYFRNRWTFHFHFFHTFCYLSPKELLKGAVESPVFLSLCTPLLLSLITLYRLAF